MRFQIDAPAFPQDGQLICDTEPFIDEAGMLISVAEHKNRSTRILMITPAQALRLAAWLVPAAAEMSAKTTPKGGKEK